MDRRKSQSDQVLVLTPPAPDEDAPVETSSEPVRLVLTDPTEQRVTLRVKQVLVGQPAQVQFELQNVDPVAAIQMMFAAQGALMQQLQQVIAELSQRAAATAPAAPANVIDLGALRGGRGRQHA